MNCTIVVKSNMDIIIFKELKMGKQDKSLKNNFRCYSIFNIANKLRFLSLKSQYY